MFITLEGIDGSGKTLQAEKLKDALESRGKNVLWTREPGGWPGGKAVRSMLLGGNISHLMTETLLFFADRCEHMSQIVQPALDEGHFVVCERYNDSTLAYQCWGRGIDRERIERLIEWCSLPKPDITFWFDITVFEALRRRTGRDAPDRIESEKLSFHEKVAAGFKALAEEEPQRIIRIDASQSPELVVKAVIDALEERGIL